MPEVFFGNNSHGTNILAEIKVLYEPLLYLHANRKLVQNHGFRVILFSDCQYVVNTVNELDMSKAVKLKQHRAIWMSILDMMRTGMSILAVHMPRNSLPAATFAHNMANAARKQAIIEKKSDLFQTGQNLLE